MAISKGLTQVTWSSSNSTTITAGSNATSDAMTFGATSFRASLQVKADNSGTPASGHTVDIYILYTNGTVDGAEGTDTYDTRTQGTWIATIDTNTDDPGVHTVEINPASKGFKLYAVNNAANSVVVSAQLYEISG